jgi:Zn-dependent protease with chaperone function
MDFFEYQDRAHRKTFRLIVLFAIAVVLIIGSVYFAFLAASWVLHVSDTESKTIGIPWWQPYLFVAVTAGTLLVVLCGTLFKTWSLRSGGPAIAGMLGGLPISTATEDLDQRKALNVVEEIAIASGTPVPQVFLLPHEPGINAFAAGYTTDDAVVGVTQGCVENLTRDELQGVIAHEFSHILNSDMRLNLRLIGVLHGILLIGLLGSQIMEGMFRSAEYSAYSRMGRRNTGGGGGCALMVAALVLGVTLMAIGFIGWAIAKAIKSAVSREREYLADASAVQFTRNPEGLASALKKIGRLEQGSRIRDTHAEEASHLFFGNGLRVSSFNAMSTHPPLEDRIKRLDPSFDGDFSEVKVERKTPTPQKRKPTLTTGQFPAGMFDAILRGGDNISVTPAAFVAQVGAPQPEHLRYARALRETIPEPLQEASREPFSARAVIYGLLLDSDSGVRRAQLEMLEEHADPDVYKETQRLLPEFTKVIPQQRLPLVDLALSAMHSTTESQFRDFCANVQRLIHADRRLDLFEFTLQRILLRHLEQLSGKTKAASVQYKSLDPLRSELEVLLSILAYAGTDDEDSASRVFAAATSKFWLTGAALDFLPKSRCGLPKVSEALDKLRFVAPKPKKQVIEACAACVIADREITVREGEILRAVCESLDCPVPPLLPGQMVM